PRRAPPPSAPGRRAARRSVACPPRTTPNLQVRSHPTTITAMAPAPSAGVPLPAEPGPAGADDGGPDGLAEALAALGDRWSLAIVDNLLEQPLRFGELQERMPAISPNVLSQRLRALQASGVVLASPYSERPPRFLYELTSAGHELAGPLR